MVKLPGLFEMAPATAAEEVQSPSSSTPLAKRQRRLTLTAMTGLISGLAQNPAAEPEAEPLSGDVELPAFPKLGAVIPAEQDLTPEFGATERESSPQRRLKRARASISVTAGADVMAAQAAKTLQAASPLAVKTGGVRATADVEAAGPQAGALVHRQPSVQSESSTSDEEEEDSLALRVRRARAFNIGTKAVEGIPSRGSAGAPNGELQKVGELSPRSQQAFSSGARAAQVAAKVAAEMLAKKAAAGLAEPPRLGQLPPTPLRPPVAQ